MSMKVLVVDDSRAMRSLIRRVLQANDSNEVRIEEAENGREALECIRKSPPDLVLTNWNMPEMSGIELLETLQRDGADVPFGFITSEGSETTIERAISAGARFVIRKPFTPSSLQSAVQQAARPQPQQRS